jgi:hypothetical protein
MRWSWLYISRYKGIISFDIRALRSLLPPSPPSEKATACQSQAHGQANTGDGGGNGINNVAAADCLKVIKVNTEAFRSASWMRTLAINPEVVSKPTNEKPPSACDTPVPPSRSS